MPLQVVREPPLVSSANTPNSTLVVILRSLRNDTNPDPDQERLWWEATVPSAANVDGIFIFVPQSGTPLESYTSNGLHRTATHFLEEIRAQTSAPFQLVLIGHTFGGYIIKQALVIAHDHPQFRSLFDAVCAVVFVGTVDNDEDEGFKKIFLLCAATELDCNYNNSPLRFLASANYTANMKRLCSDFRSIGLSSKFLTFCESKPTTYKKDKWYSHSKAKVLISSSLGSLGRQMEETIVLNLDHSEISSYPWQTSNFPAQFQNAIGDLLVGCSVVSPGQIPQPPRHQSELSIIPDFERRISLASTKGKAESTKVVYFPQAKNIPCHVISPYQRNPAFLGRASTLHHIDSILTPKSKADGTNLVSEPERAVGVRSQKKFAIIGMGGIGKTQVSLAYAFDSYSEFPVILWAHAETKVKLAQSFSDFDRELGLTTAIHSNQRDSRERVKRWLDTTDVPWLLVFDNVDTTKEGQIDEYWPSGDRGSILVTARGDASLGQFTGTIKHLDKLSDDDGIQLLLNLCKKPDTDANRAHAGKICSRIDCHPLAISSVASAVVSSKIALDEYLIEYPKVDLIRKSKPMSGPEARYDFNLEEVLSAQFVNLEGDPQTFVNILAFMDPDGIEEKFLHEGAQGADGAGLNILKNGKKFRESRDTLCIKGLVYRNEDLRKIWMHRLYQYYSHSHMDNDTFQDAFDCAFRLIAKVWPVPERHNRHNRELWSVHQQLIQHIESLAEHYRESQQTEEDEPENVAHCALKGSRGLAELFYNGGWYFYERGSMELSSSLLRTAEQYCIDHPDGSELVLADIYGAYASIDSESNATLSCQVNFQKQLDYLLEAFEKGQVQRPNVREPLAYGGLGNATMGLKRYSEAEGLYRKCLQLWKDCPGDPSMYIPHLAVCLTLQDIPAKTTEAATILQDCIKVREIKFGVRDRESFRTGIVYFALGNTQIRQGKFDDAFRTHLFALEMLEETVGKDHHRFADACYKVGWHLNRKGSHEEAGKRLSQALQIYERERIYRHELARTCFMLSQVAEKLSNEHLQRGSAEEHWEWKRKSINWKHRAAQLKKEVTKSPQSSEGSEADYDELIMFWSR